jgi:hypothetical protein
MYIPPMVIFNRVRKCPEFEDGLSPDSAVEMSDSGYVNEVLSSYGFGTSRNTQHRVQFYSFWVTMEACKLCNIARKMEQIFRAHVPTVRMSYNSWTEHSSSL